MAELISEIASCQVPRFPSTATWKGGHKPKMISLRSLTFYIFKELWRSGRVLYAECTPYKGGPFFIPTYDRTVNMSVDRWTHFTSVRADLARKSQQLNVFLSSRISSG